MTPVEITSVVISAVQGLIASTGFLLALFVGFLVVAGFSKLRKRGRDSMVVRTLGERLGGNVQYLPPDAPRGPADQLHTPELSGR